MPDDRDLVRRRLREQHDRGHEERDGRERGEDSRKAVLPADPRVGDDDRDPQQRRERQCRPRDAERTRRAVSRQGKQPHERGGEHHESRREQRDADVAPRDGQRGREAERE
jgi:hypothetical protein